MPGTITEGKAKITVADGVFYNPEMELCRGMFWLAVGALPVKVSVIDAMCASGVRGLRYKLENKNVASLALCDQSEKAVKCARKNAAANKVRCSVKKGDARDALLSCGCNFLELDPFGTPQPFLHYAARALSGRKGGFVSVTATDMAVLCGAHHAACLKNSFAVPLNNEFCHENAVRLLASVAVREFAPFSLSATPIFSFSHRHYVKLLLRVLPGAKGAEEAVKRTGYASYCPKCCYREFSRFQQNGACPHCKAALMIGGPLWLGTLWDTKLVGKMLALSARRKYAKGAQLERLLATILEESKTGATGYYDLHVLAKKAGKKIHSMDEALGRLRGAGFFASRTHFCPTAVRTDAPHGRVLSLLG